MWQASRDKNALPMKERVLCNLIEMHTGEKVSIVFHPHYYVIMWKQNGCDGCTLEEGLRIKALLQKIRLWERFKLLEFFYINGMQRAYIRR